MIPSGVPPIPASRSVPECGRHAEIAPATSPSVISRIRAPVARTSWMELRVPRPVQDAHRHVSHRQVLDLGDRSDVFRDRRGDIQHVCGIGADGDFVHVEHRRRVEHGAAIGYRQHRDGVGHALAHQRGAVNGVDGKVAFRSVAVAHFFAVVEHWCVVLFAFADDHHPAHGNRVDQFAHRVDRRAVAALLVAAAYPAARGHGSGLGHPDQLHGQVAVRGFPARWPGVRRVVAGHRGRRRTGSLSCHGW